MNKIFESLINKIDLDQYGFKLTDKKVWYLEGLVYERQVNDKKDILIVNLLPDSNPMVYEILTVTPLIRFSKVEDILLSIKENQKDHLVTLNNKNRVVIYDFSLAKENFHSSQLDNILLKLDKKLEEKAFPYFEKYQALQDVNDKLFPTLEKAPDGIPYFTIPFLRDYNNEKALIVLKLCNNSFFDEYYNWYKELVNELIEEPQGNWDIDYRVFQELDRTFLSK